MRNNIHRLTDDYRMYFRETFIFANIEGVFKGMHVTDVIRSGDDTSEQGMTFQGNTFTADGTEEYDVRWPATARIEFRPLSGYFDLRGDGIKHWVTFSVPNRTQKKGVDSRTALVGGRPGINGRNLVKVFEQSQEYLSHPGTRDFWINPAGVVHWKGMEVGNMNNGEFTANQVHQNKEAVLCRLLQAI